MAYLEGNRQVFDAGVNAIPGLRSMPLEATYLSWVDFAGTGMTREEFTRRVERDARIATTTGRPSGQAARVSCASTSPRPARGSRRPWRASVRPSPTYSEPLPMSATGAFSSRR
jgi:hypothetical protein